MDIKGKIDELTTKIKSDPDLLTKFQKEPIPTVEGLLGVDLPDDQINGVVEAVKAKVQLSSIGDKLGGLFGKKE